MGQPNDTLDGNTPAEGDYGQSWEILIEVTDTAPAGLDGLELPTVEVSADEGAGTAEGTPNDQEGGNSSSQPKSPESVKEARLPPAISYGVQWEWDEDAKDYIYIGTRPPHISHRAAR